MTASAHHSRISTTGLLRERARNRVKPRRKKRRPARGAGRPGKRTSGGRWEGKMSLSMAVEPDPLKYSAQKTAPIAKAKSAPGRISAALSLDRWAQREHPMARYANDDQGVMRDGLAMWPAAKSPRKPSAVR